MSVELRPYGFKCKEPRCDYCYQKGNFPIEKEPNWTKIKEEAKRVANKRDDNVLLFGGDVGIYPEDKVKELIEWGERELDNTISIQTGGWWIDEEWIEYLKQHDVSIGLSIDGPWPLNEFRPWGDEEQSKEYTDRLIELLPRLIDELGAGIIVTLSKANIAPDRYQQFKEWIKSLDTGGRMHILQPEGDTGVSSVRLKGVLLDLAQLEEDLDYGWTPFSDIPKILKGGTGSCVWNKCDPFHTKADYGIDPGGATVCSRNFQQGLRPLRAEQQSDIRQEVLKNTPQKDGGCKGCPYWDYCHGFCPGTAIDGDWRNKTVYCEHIKLLMSYYKGKITNQKSDSEKKKPANSAHGDWSDHGDSYGGSN